MYDILIRPSTSINCFRLKLSDISFASFSTFVNLLRPPVEMRCRADAVRLVLERGTVGKLHVFQFLDGRKVLINQRGVGQWPQVFGGLQFR